MTDIGFSGAVSGSKHDYSISTAGKVEGGKQQSAGGQMALGQVGKEILAEQKITPKPDGSFSLAGKEYKGETIKVDGKDVKLSAKEQMVLCSLFDCKPGDLSKAMEKPSVKNAITAIMKGNISSDDMDKLKKMVNENIFVDKNNPKAEEKKNHFVPSQKDQAADDLKSIKDGSYPMLKILNDNLPKDPKPSAWGK